MLSILGSASTSLEIISTFSLQTVQFDGPSLKSHQTEKGGQSRLFKPNLAQQTKLYPQKTQQSDRELAHQSMLEHQSSDA